VVGPEAQGLSDGQILAFRSQQLQWLHLEALSDPFDAPQGQVALTSFYRTHVGPVDAEYVSEGFLAETPGLAVLPEVSPHGALEVTFHDRERSRSAT